MTNAFSTNNDFYHSFLNNTNKMFSSNLPRTSYMPNSIMCCNDYNVDYSSQTKSYNTMSKMFNTFSFAMMGLSILGPFLPDITRGIKNLFNKIFHKQPKAEETQYEQPAQRPELKLDSEPAELKTFSDWTNKDVMGSLDIKEDGSYQYLNKVDDFALVDEDGQKAIAEGNEFSKNNKGVIPENKSTTFANTQQNYLESTVKIAQQEIAKNYNTDADTENISEEEYVQSDLKQFRETFNEEAPEGSDLTSKEHFKVLDFDNNKVISKEEYAAYLMATDACNDENKVDGKISSDEFLNAGKAIEGEDPDKANALVIDLYKFNTLLEKSKKAE